LPSLKYLLITLLAAVLLSSQHSYSQNTTDSQPKDTVPFVRFGNISTKFTRPTFELKKGRIVSNVLKVVNHGQRPVRFTVDALFPGGWTRIDDANKLYIAQPRDTAIVPIIISPTKLVNGDTEIIINTFVIDQNGQQIGNNFFTLTTKKTVAWGIGLQNNTTYYFKNDENYKDFKFTIDNNGNYRQDVFLSFSTPRKDLILADTLNNPLDDPNKTFTLDAGESREFAYRAIATTFNERNRQRISINNFLPTTNREKQTRILVVNSSEPRIQKTELQKRTKVNFVKLPNEIEASPYGYPYLPLIVDINAQNVLDERSFLSINLQGFKQLDQNSSLIYFTQFNYSNSFFTNEAFANAPWYVGYFDEKKTIEIGQVNGELIGAAAGGKGIKASYRFNDQHRAGAFFTNSAGLFNTRNGITSYGAWYRLRYNKDIRLRANVGRSQNNLANRSTTVATLQPSIRLLDRHNIALLTGYSLLEFDRDNASISRNGFLLGTNYATAAFDRKLRVNFNVRYNDQYFSNGTNERLFVNNRMTYDLKNDWLAIFAGNYQKIRIFNGNTEQFLFNQETFFSNFSFSKTTETGSYQPGLFYEYRDFPNNAFSTRGVNFRYATFDLERNFLSSVFIRAGYARPRNNDQIELREYFSFEANGLFRYRTWNVTARYNLGTFSAVSLQQNQNENLTPQSIRLSLQNQYLFPDRHFTLETSLIYSFNNIFKNHTLGLFPQLFYFNDTGWRFGIGANYIYTTSDFSSVFDFNDPNNPNQQNLGPTVNSDFNLNFNLRKEFGIPIPFTEKEAATTELLTFLDINGNGIKDKDETSLQNVVIKLNRNEVISDFDGSAKMKNLKYGKYKLEVFSLEELSGWFPNVQDSIVMDQDGITHIPFVRGVKVYGDVIVDRQKIAVTDDKPLDLSRIKITAVKGDKVYNTLTNRDGRFEFYLPFGEYTITMDEGILGERFRVTRNNLLVRLRNNQDGAYVSFYIVEKRRKVIFKDFTKKKN
jgi:hypothetical protein